MIIFIAKNLFLYAIYFILNQLGYISNFLWFIFGIIGLEFLSSLWRRCHLTNTRLTSEQSLGVLTALLRIRSTEIGAIYYFLRQYQKNAKDGSWVPEFMAEYRYLSSQDLYEEPCEKKKLKYRVRAFNLYSKRFSYDQFFGTLNEPELLDTAIAIQYWCAGFELTVSLLNSIHCDSILSRHVCSLLREYRLIKILSLNGNYHILFKNLWPLSYLLRESYSRLRKCWEEVICSHQAALMITQASGLSCQNTLLLDSLWRENNALVEMERNLRRALSQENHKSHGWVWDWENEVVFFRGLTANPIWMKQHGYNPYKSDNLQEQAV